MTSFTEERFPTDIQLGYTGGPEYNTNISTSSNGNETRNIFWNQPKYKYNISYAIKSEEDLQKIINFFRSKKGRAIGFRFKDYSDYKAIGEIIGISDGFRKKYKLCKDYSGIKRMIDKPVPGTVKIYVDNKLVTNYDIDYTTGIIEFHSIPALDSIIKSDCEFDVPVRFENDYLPIINSNQDFYYIDNLNLVEVKL